MNHAILSIIVSVLILLVGCSKNIDIDSSEKRADTANIAKPNVLIIITDDQGYGDLGHHGNKVINTPTLDQLFNEGVSFDKFYVSPVCAPTRASLLTGKHYLSTGVFHVTRGGEKMREDNITLAERLRDNGYNTGLFGKWHNGLQYPHDPIGQGFEEFYGFAAGHLSEYYDNFLSHNGERVKYTGYVADAITERAIEFMTESASQPFFAMLSFNTPHGPFQVPNDYFEKYKDKGLSDLNASIYGMVENIDDNVKRVLERLNSSGKLHNTIILFMSDNGPAFPDGQSRYNANLKGRKGQVDEGGVRSPLLFHWPKAALESKLVLPITQHIDIAPTILSLLNISFDEGQFHGRDLTPLMMTENPAWEPRALFTHRFNNHKDVKGDYVLESPGAVRTDKYLAVYDDDRRWRLYDLQNDPQQSENLAQQKPDILLSHKKMYTDWYLDITQRHGPYTTIPIEVGHKGHDRVELPAHESLITKNLVYYNGDGWSHDWLASETETTGSSYWPLKVIHEGTYSLVLRYATPEIEYNGKISIGIGETQHTKSLPAYAPTELSTERLYFTDEAPDLTWNEIEIKEIRLNEGQQNLVVSFSNDEHGRSLWLKELILYKN